MELEKELLRYYGINNPEIEQVTDQLYAVTDSGRRYALKRSRRLAEKADLWESVHQQASRGILRGVLPLYASLQERYALSWNEEAYYLMPWISGRSGDLADLYETIGHIHARTKQAAVPDYSGWIQSFHTYQHFLKTASHTLEEHVARFESKRYMSPFELTFCTQYTEVKYGLSLLGRQTERMIQLLETEPAWSKSLVHGDLKMSHLVTGTSSYLINWERSEYDHAAADLLSFFKNEAASETGFARRDRFTGSFDSYMKENKLSEIERVYLSIQLLNPAVYLQCAADSYTNRSRRPMLAQVAELNSHFRLLMFGIHWTHFWDETERENKSLTASDPAQIEREEQAGNKAEQ